MIAFSLRVLEFVYSPVNLRKEQYASLSLVSRPITLLSLKSDSHLPKKFSLFASRKALSK